MRRTYGNMRGGVVASLEEENLIQQEGEVEPAADGLEAALLETSEELPAGEAEVGDIEEAGTATDELQEVQEVAEAAQDKGGLDQVAAEMMRISVESICARVGYKRTQTRLPALESFGGTSTRITSTNLAIEEIKDKIKEIWKAIVAAIKRAIEWVAGFFNKYFGAAEKLKKRAAALKEKADTTTGVAEEKTFENASLFKALAISGKVTASALPAAADEMVKVYGGYKTHFESVAKGGDEISTALASVEAAGKYQYNPITEGRSEADVYGDGREGYAFYRSPELLGGVAFVNFQPKTKPAAGTDSLQAYGLSEESIKPFNPKAPEVTATNLEVLQPKFVGEIAAKVGTLADEALSFRGDLKKAQEALKKVAGAAEKEANTAEKQEGADKELIGAMRKAAGAAVKHLTAGPAGVSSYILRSGAAMVQYGEVSLSKYKKAA